MRDSTGESCARTTGSSRLRSTGLGRCVLAGPKCLRNSLISRGIDRRGSRKSTSVSFLLYVVVIKRKIKKCVNTSRYVAIRDFYFHSAKFLRSIDDARNGGVPKDSCCAVSESEFCLDGRSAMLFFEHTLSI